MLLILGGSNLIQSDRPNSGRLRIGAHALVVLAGCLIGAWTATRLVFPEVGTAVLFPPYAILTAMLILTPMREWWVYVLAAFAGNFGPHALHEGLSPFIFVVELANDSRALVAAMGVRWFVERSGYFDTLPSMTAYLVSAVLVGPAVGAFIGAGAVVARNPAASFWVAWQAWLLSNMLTGLTLLPLILILYTRGWTWLNGVSRARTIEAAALAVGMIVVGVFIFDRFHAHGLIPASLYAPLPLLIWAAVRFGPGGMILALSTLTGLTIAGAMSGRGPFTNQAPAENLLELQYFLIALCIPLMLLAAIVEQQMQTAKALRLSRANYRAIVEDQTELICRFLPDGTYTFVNDAYCRWYQAEPEHFLDRKRWDFVPAALHDAIRANLVLISPAKPAAILEYEIPTAAGEMRWQQWTQRGLFDEHGKIIAYQAVGRDITELKRVEQSKRSSEAELRLSYDKIQDLAGRLIVAEEAERKRIARELHDGINQQLAGLSIRLSGFKRRLPESAAELQRDVASLQNDAMDVVESIRGLSHELHPGILQHAGLVPTLKAHCADFQRQASIETTFSSDGVDMISPEISLCLYRIAQESLRNVALHAGARSVQVALSRENGHVRLSIADDGRGFDPMLMGRSGGLGLLSIEERVRLVQGSCKIESRPEHGTQIHIRVPLEGASHGTS